MLLLWYLEPWDFERGPVFQMRKSKVWIPVQGPLWECGAPNNRTSSLNRPVLWVVYWGQHLLGFPCSGKYLCMYKVPHVQGPTCLQDDMQVCMSAFVYMYI